MSVDFEMVQDRITESFDKSDYIAPTIDVRNKYNFKFTLYSSMYSVVCTLFYNSKGVCKVVRRMLPETFIILYIVNTYEMRGIFLNQY